jgi:hypothetical protein
MGTGVKGESAGSSCGWVNWEIWMVGKTPSRDDEGVDAGGEGGSEGG